MDINNRKKLLWLLIPLVLFISFASYKLFIEKPSDKANINSPSDSSTNSVIDTFQDKEIYENELLEFEILFKDEKSEKFTYTSENLPEGADIVINSSGKYFFTWKPNYKQAGIYNISFNISNDSGFLITKTIKLTVLNFNRPPILFPIGAKTVSVNEKLQFSISAIDTDLETELVYTCTSIPSGGKFESASTTFTWTPTSTQIGDFKVVFTVSDGSLTATETITISVKAETPPTNTTTNPPSTTNPPTTITVNYYVATTGNDTNPGTSTKPFRTIQKAANIVKAGELVYVRSGIYYEKLIISNSGTASKKITIKADPSSTTKPIIDGRDAGMNVVEISGDYVVFDGFEIRNQSYSYIDDGETVYDGTLLLVTGNYNVVKKNKVHTGVGRGIKVGNLSGCSGGLAGTDSNYNIIEYNEVYDTSRKTILYDSSSWSTAIAASRCPRNTTIRYNVVHETYGLGIGPYESYYNYVQGNVIYNNMHDHIYINNAPNSTVVGNLIYVTDGIDPKFYQEGKDHPGAGIAISDEKSFPLNTDVKIINNIVLNTNGFYYFNNGYCPSGLKNFVIANNTFVNFQNDYTNTPVIVRNDECTGQNIGTRIYNNIISEESNYDIIYLDNPGGLDFSHNLWSDDPSDYISISDEYIGNPNLAKTGTVSIGGLTSSWFKLLSTSPAINKALVLPEVTVDFTGKARGTSPDIGAMEY